MLRAASIRSQLLTLFGLAVLPAVALSAGLTWHVYHSLKTTVASHHIQSVANIASRVRGSMTGADILAGTLLVGAARDGVEKFCATLPDYQKANRRSLAYGYYRDGRLVCAAGDIAALSGFTIGAGTRVAKDPATGDKTQESRETILARKIAPYYLAVETSRGTQDTFLTVLAPEYLRNVLERTQLGRSSPFAIVDGHFHIIARNRHKDQSAWLPAKEGGPAATRKALSGSASFDGGEYSYISAPVEPGVAALLSVKPKPRFGQAEQQLVISLAVPLLIFAIVMAVAWLAIDRLFLRWMRRLAKTARRLSYGDFSVRAELPAVAPLELQQYANAFDQMTEVLGARTRELATVANQRSDLLKELHHRVKNNFQVIASFLNLTKRQKHGETYEVLALSECRVHAMATAYKLALAHGDIRMAPLTLLVHEVLSYVQQAAGAPCGVIASFGVDAQQDEQYLELDRAIPLALLLVETTWPLLSGDVGAARRARLDFIPEGHIVKLVVSALQGDETAVAASQSNLLMSQRLQHAFINQIEGQPLSDMELDAIRGQRDAGERIVLAIRLPVRGDDGVH